MSEAKELFEQAFNSWAAQHPHVAAAYEEHVRAVAGVFYHQGACDALGMARQIVDEALGMARQIVDEASKAPMLLVALKDLCDVASTEDLPRRVRDQALIARQAIARAEGKE